MRILSWNVNGLRSVYSKGFLAFIKKYKPDIICLQEIKTTSDKLPLFLSNLKGYYSFFNSAIKPGYSGVAVYTKIKPIKIEKKLKIQRFDNEGRLIKLTYKNFTLINIYVPHGGRQKQNLDYKLSVYKKLISVLKTAKQNNLILIGDFNIAHEDIDLSRPKANRNNIMFTVQERKQIGDIIKCGYMDTFRQYHPTGGNYTWWPYMAKARQRNIGWRIDYAFVSNKLNKKVRKAYILNTVLGSDHCPIGLDIIS